MSQAVHFPVVEDKEPIRLFRSGLLEFFTHIHPAVVLVIWVPVALYFLHIGFRDAKAVSASYAHIPPAFLLGLFLWSLTEYLLHRFVFHFPPRSPRQERITFLFHGVHHAQPMCKTRLVMPPIVSFPLALLFYGIFQLVFMQVLSLPQWFAPAFSGFITGYLFYDMMHYSTHHIPMSWRWYKWLKFNHMAHHFKTPDRRFGVSSGLWDVIFRTKPDS